MAPSCPACQAQPRPNPNSEAAAWRVSLDPDGNGQISFGRDLGKSMEKYGKVFIFSPKWLGPLGILKHETSNFRNSHCLPGSTEASSIIDVGRWASLGTCESGGPSCPQLKWMVSGCSCHRFNQRGLQNKMSNSWLGFSGLSSHENSDDSELT